MNPVHANATGPSCDERPPEATSPWLSPVHAPSGPLARSEQQERNRNRRFLLNVLLARGWKQEAAAEALGVSLRMAQMLTAWQGFGPLSGQSLRVVGVPAREPAPGRKLPRCSECGRLLSAGELWSGKCSRQDQCERRAAMRSA